MLRWFPLGLTFALLGPGGCGPKETSNPTPEGRGSDACRAWQDAACDWLDKCGGGSAEQVSACRQQAAGVVCTSDTAAQRCSKLLKANACTSPPSGCDLDDLADPAPARAACDQYIDAVCEAVSACGGVKSDCLATPSLVALCDDVIGSTLAFDDCLAALADPDCSTSALPDICRGIFFTASSP